MRTLKIKLAAVASILTMMFASCGDQVEETARYTFTGHTIASFLEEHSDVYSSFIHILDRGGRLSLMKAYGQYTCFAPTNDAIARFLHEQDSLQGFIGGRQPQ